MMARGNHFLTGGSRSKRVTYVDFHKRHMQFLTSSLNFRRSAEPSPSPRPGLPEPLVAAWRFSYSRRVRHHYINDYSPVHHIPLAIDNSATTPSAGPRSRWDAEPRLTVGPTRPPVQLPAPHTTPSDQ